MGRSAFAAGGLAADAGGSAAGAGGLTSSSFGQISSSRGSPCLSAVRLSEFPATAGGGRASGGARSGLTDLRNAFSSTVEAAGFSRMRPSVPSSGKRDVSGDGSRSGWFDASVLGADEVLSVTASWIVASGKGFFQTTNAPAPATIPATTAAASGSRRGGTMRRGGRTSVGKSSGSVAGNEDVGGRSDPEFRNLGSESGLMVVIARQIRAVAGLVPWGNL